MLLGTDEITDGCGSHSLMIGEQSGGSAGAYYITVTNSVGTASYPLNLNPWGGNIGIGTDTPASTVHIDLPIEQPPLTTSHTAANR